MVFLWTSAKPQCYLLKPLKYLGKIFWKHIPHILLDVKNTLECFTNSYKSQIFFQSIYTQLACPTYKIKTSIAKVLQNKCKT